MTIIGRTATCPTCGTSVGPTTHRLSSGCRHATLIAIPEGETYGVNAGSHEVVLFQAAPS